jgi:hypothetical protein
MQGVFGVITWKVTSLTPFLVRAFNVFFFANHGPDYAGKGDKGILEDLGGKLDPFRVGAMQAECLISPHFPRWIPMRELTEFCT